MRELLLGVVVLAIAGGIVTASRQSASAPAQATLPRTDAAISGVVIDALTKQPIEDAVVEIRRPGERGATAFSQGQSTDAKGRFVFTELRAGTYSVRATGPGYFGNAAGALGDDEWQIGVPIVVSDGQWHSSATIELWPVASISGAVLDESGQPVVGVFVRAVMPIRVAGIDQWAVGQITVTDDRGIYRIGQLHAGRYIVMVPSVQASVPSSASAPSLFGLDRDELAAFQAGARPLMATRPALIDVSPSTRLRVAGYPSPPPPVEGRARAYPITFAGSRSLSQASPVVVRAGEDRAGVDVRLEPVPVVRVSGVVDGGAGAGANMALRLVAEGLEDFGSGGETATTVTQQDGSFEFAHVPPGRYTLEAPLPVSQFTIGNMGLFYTPELPFAPGLSAASRIGGAVDSVPGIGFTASSAMGTSFIRQSVTVGPEDTTGIVATVRPLLRMQGRLVGEAEPNRPAPSTPPRYVELQPATASPRLGIPRSSNTRNVQPGQFAIEGILPGSYVLQSSDQNWTIKSVIVDGRDCTNTPIDITGASALSDTVVTFTNASQALTGVVTAAPGSRTGDAAVIAFPVEPVQWTRYGLNPARIKSVPTATDGSFRITTLPAGSYYVIAVPASQRNAWREPDFFKRAQPLASRVAIGWGEERATDLRVTNVR